MQHSMELSSKLRMFRVSAPIGIHWARRYEVGYELLQSDKKKTRRRRRVMPTIRLGRRKTGLFMGRICRRFRVRILRAYSYIRRLMLRRLKAFYLRLLAELGETGPGVDLMANSSAFINAHFVISALPPPSFSAMTF